MHETTLTNGTILRSKHTPIIITVEGISKATADKEHRDKMEWIKVNADEMELLTLYRLRKEK